MTRCICRRYQNDAYSSMKFRRLPIRHREWFIFVVIALIRRSIAAGNPPSFDLCRRQCREILKRRPSFEEQNIPLASGVDASRGTHVGNEAHSNAALCAYYRLFESIRHDAGQCAGGSAHLSAPMCSSIWRHQTGMSHLHSTCRPRACWAAFDHHGV